MVKQWLRLVLALCVIECLFAGSNPSQSPLLLTVTPNNRLTADKIDVEIGEIITVKVQNDNPRLPPYSFNFTHVGSAASFDNSNNQATSTDQSTDVSEPFAVISTEQEMANGTLQLRAVHPGNMTLTVSSSTEPTKVPYTWNPPPSNRLSLTVLPPLLQTTVMTEMNLSEKISDLEWSADGRLLGAMGEQTAYVWTIDDTSVKDRRDFVVGIHPTANEVPGLIAFNPSGDVLYRSTTYLIPNSFDVHGQVLRWNIATGGELPSWNTDDRYRYGGSLRLEMNPDGDTLGHLLNLNSAGCARQKTYFYQWDRASGNRLPTLSLPLMTYPGDLGQHITNFAYGGSYLALQVVTSLCMHLHPEQRQLVIYKNGVNIKTLPSPGFAGVDRLDFSRDGHYLAASTQSINQNQTGSNDVYVWHDFEPDFVFSRIDPIGQIAISSDNRYLLIPTVNQLDENSQVRVNVLRYHVIELATGLEMGRIDTGSHKLGNFALSPDGQIIAYAIDQHIFILRLAKRL